jgi:hypothetical protein
MEDGRDGERKEKSVCLDKVGSREKKKGEEEKKEKKRKVLLLFHVHHEKLFCQMVYENRFNFTGECFSTQS